MAGAAEPQQQGAIGFIEIYDLDLAAMGGNVRPQGIECLLDPVQDSYF